MTSTVEKERTKNKSSYRTLPLIAEVKVYLLQLKRKQKEAKLLHGGSHIDNDYVNKWEDGKPFTPDYISRTFKKILTKNKLQVIRFHDLRHTTASLLLSKGFSLKEIQEYLGHANINTTSDIYGHLEYKAKITMADKLGELVSFKIEYDNPIVLEKC